MADWSTSEIGFTPDEDNVMVKPPFLFLGISGAFLVASVAFLFVDSRLGYLITVLTSLLGGVTALQDQKKRGNSNYISYEWFTPLMRSVRFATLIVALAHIVRLAFDARDGGGLW